MAVEVEVCPGCGEAFRSGDKRCRNCFLIRGATPESRQLENHASPLSPPKRTIVLATLDDLPGRRVVEVLGTVFGSTIRTGHLLAKMAAGVRDLVGGEHVEYAKVMTGARQEAITRMLIEADQLGADAVLGFRLSTSDVFESAAEIVAYGTAVRTDPSD